MTQDQILAALREVVAENSHFTTWTVSTPHLVALVNLAIEREREACAKWLDFYDGPNGRRAKGIRERIDK